jgi:phosphopantothenoylcysteine decarboxylase / phosphopantothenate---cysteine ligase
MKILLGVTGCIAAYKSAELVRLLQKHGHEVFVVMTDNACRFITPLTMETLSQHQVITSQFLLNEGSPAMHSPLEHIHLVNSVDIFLVAPATANTIGKFAHGIADDFLSTAYLAAKTPVVIAPAMNVNMWQHPAVQENMGLLRSRGVTVIDPEEGYLAEGIYAKGRLADLEAIVRAIGHATVRRNDLRGETVLVTAGPTCEDIDPVRFLSNRSSGKMGYCLAAAAKSRGARTILVSGPTRIDPPPEVELYAVRSAEEMRNAVLNHLSEASIVIKAAAVADFRPRIRASEKIKKVSEDFILDLERTPDILLEVSRIKGNRLLVGFAAETENVLENARKKLQAKQLDLMVVNDVTAEGAGFEVDTNVVTILTRGEREIRLGKLPKLDVAEAILDQIVALKRSETPPPPA